MHTAKYLLDTHCLLWFQGNESRIPNKVIEIIQNPENSILFSQISLFEITIKQSIGKLPEFKSDTDEVYHQAIKDNLTFLSLRNEHLRNYSRVPLFPQHHDPFDRLLIASAYEENAIILTTDKHFSLYKDFVRILW